jgi:hypothetical protein
MNKSILTFPAWMLFVGFFLAATVADVAASMIGKNLGWDWDYGAFPTLRFGLISLVWWSYPYMVGRALSQQSYPRAHKAILLIVLLAIVNNALSVYLSEAYGVIWYIVLITIVMNVYCAIRVFAFPAIELKSRKLGRRARLPEAWSELLLFVLWPLCVWWTQQALAAFAENDRVKVNRL